MKTFVGFLVGALAFVSVAAAQEKTPEKQVVVGVFGGVLGQQLRKNIESFTEPRGINAVFVEGTASELFAKVAAQKENPQIDLFMGNVLTFTGAKGQGLTAPLKPELVPNLERVL